MANNDLHRMDAIIERQRAEIEWLTEERDLCKQVFESALSHVDVVFQQCQEIPRPILPDYTRPGENKFAAVKRLALDYLECRKLLRELLAAMRDGDGWLPQWGEGDEWVIAARKTAGGDQDG